MDDDKTRKMTITLGYTAAAALASWAVLNVLTIIITFAPMG